MHIAFLAITIVYSVLLALSATMTIRRARSNPLATTSSARLAVTCVAQTERASVADVPARTGMGSSGAFTVCILKALAHARSTEQAPRERADQDFAFEF